MCFFVRKYFLFCLLENIDQLGDVEAETSNNEEEEMEYEGKRIKFSHSRGSKVPYIAFPKMAELQPKAVADSQERFPIFDHKLRTGNKNEQSIIMDPTILKVLFDFSDVRMLDNGTKKIPEIEPEGDDQDEMEYFLGENPSESPEELKLKKI